MGLIVGIEDAESALVSTSLTLELLGPMRVSRDEEALVLPASRKLRGLLAYLALASHATTRNHLCELLWDTPSDPRGELRWALSKLRGVLDEPGRTRVKATGESVRLDVTDVRVDALEVQRAIRSGLATCDVEQLRNLAARFRGDFLEGLTIDRSAPFSAWLLAQRRSLRVARLSILERLTQALPASSDEALDVLETWIQLAPLALRAHEILLGLLAERGRFREGEEHLAATARLFDAEGQDWRPLGTIWRELRTQHVLAHSSGGATEERFPVRRQGDLQVRSADEQSDLPAAALSGFHLHAPRDSGVSHRASVAVMPFECQDGEMRASLGDALTTDVITRLAKLRSLFVIAEGTVLSMQTNPWDAGQRLKMEYVASGAVQRDGDRVSVVVQLIDTSTARIVWTDLFEARLGNSLTVPTDQISSRIANAVASQIEQAERNRAIVKPSQLLNAWEAHHLGLWCMYRFDREENIKAQQYFEQATRLDPGFARPHAGLAFTHVQRVYLGWGESGPAIEQASRSAAQAVQADELDPLARWAMSIVLWTQGRRQQALAELQAALELSPNFALGHYSLGYALAQTGDARVALATTDYASELSPYDPLRLLADPARALALLRLGRHAEAADEAVKSLTRPNAHAHSYGLAAMCLMLAERREEAVSTAAALRQRWPHYCIDNLLAALYLQKDFRTQFRAEAPGLGLG